MRTKTALFGGLALCLALVSCGRFGGADPAELCTDLTNLQSTIEALAAPARGATVGEVRGNLDRLDGTFDAVHRDDRVSDAEDDALLQSQEDYRDAIQGIGDDDDFAPYVPVTRGAADGLLRSYGAVRATLGCPMTPAA